MTNCTQQVFRIWAKTINNTKETV